MRKRKTKHQKIIELLNTQSVQAIPYAIAQFLKTPEVGMGALILLIEYIKPKMPLLPPKTYRGKDMPEKYMPEDEMIEKLREQFEELTRQQGETIGKSTFLGTQLPQIKTMSPLPDFSGLNIYDAVQISLLFAIVLRNIPKTEIGVA